MTAFPQAPAWVTTTWLNTPTPLSLEALRGKVILLHAFQMLCPGCVARGIPQAQRVAELFADAPLAVVGLHTVFEHHEAMGEVSLRAFLHEYRVRFPVGIDAPGLGAGSIPRTMQAYGMRGTPTTVLIDAGGRLRRQYFGVHDDLLLGAELQSLILEARRAETPHPLGAAGDPPPSSEPASADAAFPSADPCGEICDAHPSAPDKDDHSRPA